MSAHGVSSSRPSSWDSRTVDYATPEFEEFEDSINFHELCAVASSYRDGMSCQLGEYVKYEIKFSDGIVWIARFPLAYQCYLSEEMSASYAATLKLLKKDTTLPVPEIYGSFARSDESNKVNATYVLTQRLEGRILPSLDYDDPGHYTDRHSTKEFAQARKIHGQWTDIMLQLTCLPFDKIGSLQEGPDGEFFVGSVLHPAYARFKEKTSIYRGFEPHLKGPYSSTAEYYGAAAELGRAFSLVDPCYEDSEMDSDFKYEVIDDNFNIVGINEFSGLVVDLPSFCQMPEFQRSNSYCGYVDDYKYFAKIFMNRHSQYPESALHTRKVRREMMASAETVLDFEMGLFSIFAGPNLPKLFEELWKRPYDRKVEFQRLADTRPWFKELHEKWKPRSTFSEWVSWVLGLWRSF
ncbi:hypothetical protein N7513_002988 [Penicillium frequentans]|nr:hypothetical protein N7513_002988 [Penicillium glabrum]